MKTSEEVARLIDEARATDKATMHQLSLEIDELSQQLEFKEKALKRSAETEVELRKELERIRNDGSLSEPKKDSVHRSRETVVQCLYAFLAGVFCVIVCNVFSSVMREWLARNSTQENSDVD